MKRAAPLRFLALVARRLGRRSAPRCWRRAGPRRRATAPAEPAGRALRSVPRPKAHRSQPAALPPVPAQSTAHRLEVKALVSRPTGGGPGTSGHGSDRHVRRLCRLQAGPSAPMPVAARSSAEARGRRRSASASFHRRSAPAAVGAPAAGPVRSGCCCATSGGGPRWRRAGRWAGARRGRGSLYRVGGGLALSGAPLCAAAADRGRARWRRGSTGGRRPRLPVHLLAERRQRLGKDGPLGLRADPLRRRERAACPPGCAARPMPRRGWSGLRSRDPFVDGSVRVGLPLGPVEIGGGAWGAAQPGAARLDAGPSDRLPAAGPPRQSAPPGRLALPPRRRRRARLRPGAHPRRRFLTPPRLPRARFPVRVAAPWTSICRSRACR